MSDRSVRIAICMKDRVARQLACSMFSSAGAEIQVCDDTTAIKAAADAADLHAIVLGLGVAPETTFDALVLLRQWFSNLPIYVIADAAGQRHAKRTKAFGATQVILHEELQRRVGTLIRQAAQSAKKDDWEVRPPGWVPGNDGDGYEVQSMDLGAWLSVPGNRRLLGMKDASGAGPGTSAPSAEPGASSGPSSGPVSGPVSGSSSGPASGPAPPPAPTPFVTPGIWTTAPAAPPPEPPPVAAQSSRPVAPAPAPGYASASATAPLPAVAVGAVMPCGLSNCSLLDICRVEHDAQTAAIMEAQKQRDKRTQEQNQALRDRLQAELRTEIQESLATIETRMQQNFDERLRLGFGATVARLKLLVGVLGAVLVLLGVGLVWRLGPWW